MERGWHARHCSGMKALTLESDITNRIFERKGNMAYMNRFNQTDERRRDELIRIIEHSVEKLTLAELEALYYDMTTKSFIND